MTTKERKLRRYIRANRERYLGMATIITPIQWDKNQAFARIAFAILSANARFDQAVEALAVVVENKGRVTPQMLLRYGMFPAKADYVNKLWGGMRWCGINETWWTRQPLETWVAYRERMMAIKGLHRAKASFAIGLLYPKEADIACLDTWMCKFFLRSSAFKVLPRQTYERLEDIIRGYASSFHINTFMCQWLIWDHVRGTVQDHAIFPGAHKEATR